MIGSYDGYAIHMFVAHEAFTVANQEAAGCIINTSYGMTCAIISTHTNVANEQ